jgi:hypothetical protein
LGRLTQEVDQHRQTAQTVSQRHQEGIEETQTLKDALAKERSRAEEQQQTIASLQNDLTVLRSHTQQELERLAAALAEAQIQDTGERQQWQHHWNAAEQKFILEREAMHLEIEELRARVDTYRSALESMGVYAAQ